jgi:tetratricopeptide (TPR) repeat protein
MQERLQLFIQVCNAVQHAHQKGIIHRDLKPSNIMVTMHDGVPVPKVIDFGIAKATEQRLTDKTLFTSYAQLMGTPAYMSPEQMELSGLNLDTRSDIYSLGILLYELLTGRTPFDTADLLKLGVDELRRTVREQEPLSPSAKLQTLNNEELTKTAKRRHIEPPRLLSQLRGDLDWIVLKCLEKDRTRRYATANGLAMDIERYLHEEAVLARPPSQLYRLQKLVRRNRMVFLFGAVAAAALLLGTIISTMMFVRERQAHASEERLRREAEAREKVTRAALLASQDKNEEADRLMGGTPLEKPSVEAETVLRRLGEWHAVNGRWLEAAERFGALDKMNRLNNLDGITMDYLRLGSALIESSDRSGYERFRHDIIARFAGRDTLFASRILKASLLLAANQTLMQDLQPQGEVVERNVRAMDQGGNASVAYEGGWDSLSLGLLEYRRGNYDKATNWCLHCLAYPLSIPHRNATAQVILAMCYWQTNEKSKALLAWGTGLQLIQDRFQRGLVQGNNAEGFWFDWIIARILSRECQEQFMQAGRRLAPPDGLPPSLANATVFREMGELHAVRQEWQEAGGYFTSLLRVNQLDGWNQATLDYLACGVVLAMMRDARSYVSFREEAIRRFEETNLPIPAERIVKISLLQPADGKVLAALAPLAEVAARPFTTANESAETKSSREAWSAMSLGLFEYRSGHYARAIEWCRSCLACREVIPVRTATARLILAMSLRQDGRQKAVLAELEQAHQLIKSGFDAGLKQGRADRGLWFDWVFARLLQQEADSLIPQAPSPEPQK